MAADGKILQGEVSTDGETDTTDVEGLLMGFLKALLRETEESK